MYLCHEEEKGKCTQLCSELNSLLLVMLLCFRIFPPVPLRSVVLVASSPEKQY